MVKLVGNKYAVIIAILGLAYFINSILHQTKPVSHPPLIVDKRYVNTLVNTADNHASTLHLFYNSTMLRVYNWDGEMIHYDNAIKVDLENELKFYISVGNNTIENNKWYALMFIMDGLVLPFYIDFDTKMMESYRFQLQKHHILNIPVSISIMPEIMGRSDGMLRILLLRFPNDMSRKYIPYFTQGLQVRVEWPASSIHNDKSTITPLTLQTSYITVDEGQYRIANNGTILPSQFEVHAGKTYTLQLLMRPGYGVFRTILLLKDGPIRNKERESSILWKSEEGHTYVQQYELTVPQKPGDYYLFAITFDESSALEPGSTHEHTTLLHKLRVVKETDNNIHM